VVESLPFYTTERAPEQQSGIGGSRVFDQKTKQLVILTGASGSGKTTLAKRVAAHCGQSVLVRHFDAIEVPSLKSMTAVYGSPEEWQRCKTQEWISKLAKLPATRVLFEGQSRIEFIASALKEAEISDATILLVDCRDADRIQRLMLTRRQPDLATDQMLKWAAHLRQEAREFGCETLDTSECSIEDCVDRIASCFQ